MKNENLYIEQTEVQLTGKRVMPRQKPGQSVQIVATPPDFMAAVVAVWGKMDVDLAAEAENSKAPVYISREIDSLKYDWTSLKGNLWLNCEYADIAAWAAKCAPAAPVGQNDRRVFLLVPASVGSNWYAEHVHGKALVTFPRPRIKFTGHTQAFPKDLLLAIYGEQPGVETWRWK